MSESQSFVMNAVQPPKALRSEMALNVQKHFPISATAPASKLQTAFLRRALFCPHICHLQGLNLICDYKVMRLTFKQITDLMNPDECWPSKDVTLGGWLHSPWGCHPDTMTGISLWKLPAGTISQLQKKIENQSHHSVALMALKCDSLFWGQPPLVACVLQGMRLTHFCTPRAVHRAQAYRRPFINAW